MYGTFTLLHTTRLHFTPGFSLHFNSFIFYLKSLMRKPTFKPCGCQIFSKTKKEVISEVDTGLKIDH